MADVLSFPEWLIANVLVALLLLLGVLLVVAPLFVPWIKRFGR